MTTEGEASGHMRAGGHAKGGSTHPDCINVDVLVIGSGAGGSTLAWGLRQSGARILVVERGPTLAPLTPRTTTEGLVQLRATVAAETWRGDGNTVIHPRDHYCVGGNTKFYAAHLARLRAEDFTDLPHRDGTSPAWPFSYADLEPYYLQAERLYNVHGAVGDDPTEPPHSGPYPQGPVPSEPYVDDLSDRLRVAGMHPYAVPLGIDLGTAGRCVRCGTCDGLPCTVGAKSDAETMALRPALGHREVSLWTGTQVLRLHTSSDGRRVVAATAHRRGEPVEIRAGSFVVSSGAVNSAALLLRSASAAHPHGLANGSDLVGRRYMRHHLSHVLAVDAERPNATVFQKTLAFNDHYLSGPDTAWPMGNVQLVGKLTPEATDGGDIEGTTAWSPGLTHQSADWLCISEDLPNHRNRIRLRSDGGIALHLESGTPQEHRALVGRTGELFLDIGFQRVFTRTFGPGATSHQCGTVVAGSDPARSVIDPLCRAHEVDNLFVVDAGFFPSSAAMNPALTIMAQALRVAEIGAVLP